MPLRQAGGHVVSDQIVVFELLFPALIKLVAVEPKDAYGGRSTCTTSTAATSHAADTLLRNGQLPEQERAMLQPKRQIGVLNSATKRAFEAEQGAGAK